MTFIAHLFLSITQPQILALRVLRSILPSWKKGINVAEQEQMVESLLQLLGKTLLLCHSPTMRAGGGGVMSLSCQSCHCHASHVTVMSVMSLSYQSCAVNVIKQSFDVT